MGLGGVLSLGYRLVQRRSLAERLTGLSPRVEVVRPTPFSKLG